METVDPSVIYLNARVRGMRSQLLTREQFEEVLEAGTLTALSDLLLASAYQPELAESLARYEGADAIEDAVSRNLVHTFQTLRRAAQGDVERLVDIFLARWDLAAVKALLRNRHHELDFATGGQALIPGPTMTVALLQEFAALPTMDELAAALAAWNSGLCNGLVKALPGYHEHRQYHLLEDALDRGYFVYRARQLKNAPEPGEQFLGLVLQMEIDRINIRTIIALRVGDASTEMILARMLPGGRIPQASLAAMIEAAGVEQAFEVLSASPYRDVMHGQAHLIQTNRFSSIERLFEGVFMKQLAALCHAHALSFAIVLHYVWLKYNEVVNVRVIARGEARHLPKGRVREEMVYA